ncbi:hypothetical protein [Nisaea nitritireducens]|uniref:hypothetical protein n=1 Tax=Nisaea nitritireducens TaxID=568392 RepID=UPI0018667557|nr:hypothetical protein [Nisaea nitritireducens]
MTLVHSSTYKADISPDALETIYTATSPSGSAIQNVLVSHVGDPSRVDDSPGTGAHLPLGTSLIYGDSSDVAQTYYINDERSLTIFGEPDSRDGYCVYMQVCQWDAAKGRNRSGPPYLLYRHSEQTYSQRFAFLTDDKFVTKDTEHNNFVSFRINPDLSISPIGKNAGAVTSITLASIARIDDDNALALYYDSEWKLAQLAVPDSGGITMSADATTATVTFPGNGSFSDLVRARNDTVEFVLMGYGDATNKRVSAFSFDTGTNTATQTGTQLVTAGSGGDSEQTIMRKVRADDAYGVVIGRCTGAETQLPYAVVVFRDNTLTDTNSATIGTTSNYISNASKMQVDRNTFALVSSNSSGYAYVTFSIDNTSGAITLSMPSDSGMTRRWLFGTAKQVHHFCRGTGTYTYPVRNVGDQITTLPIVANSVNAPGFFGTRPNAAFWHDKLNLWVTIDGGYYLKFFNADGDPVGLQYLGSTYESICQGNSGNTVAAVTGSVSGYTAYSGQTFKVMDGLRTVGFNGSTPTDVTTDSISMSSGLRIKGLAPVSGMHYAYVGWYYSSGYYPRYGVLEVGSAVKWSQDVGGGAVSGSALRGECYWIGCDAERNIYASLPYVTERIRLIKDSVNADGSQGGDTVLSTTPTLPGHAMLGAFSQWGPHQFIGVHHDLIIVSNGTDAADEKGNWSRDNMDRCKAWCSDTAAVIAMVATNDGAYRYDAYLMHDYSVIVSATDIAAFATTDNPDANAYGTRTTFTLRADDASWLKEVWGATDTTVDLYMTCEGGTVDFPLVREREFVMRETDELPCRLTLPQGESLKMKAGHKNQLVAAINHLERV